MRQAPCTSIIISVSSDIGTALSQRWLAKGQPTFGTYRTPSPAVDDLMSRGMVLVPCDLSQPASVKEACSLLKDQSLVWDVLVLCPGMLEPVGPFAEADFDEWEHSLRVNFSSQMRIVHELLPCRRVGSDLGPCVLFFAGGGTNSAPVNYSAYTVSKIGLIKMCELLQAEIQDTRFVILGPGWVHTKMHEATLKAGAHAGPNYQRTVDKLTREECIPMDVVLDCCEWIIDSPSRLVGGRNFSAVYDLWGSEKLAKLLQSDSNVYKLRRYANDWLVKDGQ